MCGIAGIVSLNKNEISTTRLKTMTDALSHRGPDGEGYWINEDGLIGLGHRRLAIIDLTDKAQQPMHCPDKYSMVFNGAIYNYEELREMCIGKGYHFFSRSDTEVIMAMYDWKKEECLSYFDGMFAFVLHDAKEKTVFIARDRFGEKPLYYHHEPGKSFVFASEMKALWAAGIPKAINQRMLYNYMAFNYTQNEEDLSETFFQHIRSLSPAHYVRLDTSTLQLSLRKYWDIDYNKTDPEITLEQAKEKFNDLFYTSVDRRLRSDVPVGSSLSGGIDSSAVVAVINDLGKTNQSVFSAIFPGYEKDETGYIKELLKKIPAHAHFASPDATSLLNDLGKCFYYQEEPFGSASVLAQYEVMNLAKQHHVTVLLDGQGADEMLAGYHDLYPVFFKELQQKDKMLYAAEQAAYKSLFSDSHLNPVPVKNLRYYARQSAEKDRLKKIRERIRQLINPYFTADFFHSNQKEQFNTAKPVVSLNEALYNSVKYGLPQLLRFADRNSMANGRELRLPFLFHELAEFLFTLPASFKIHNGWTKYIQRVVFEELLPSSITWRKDKIAYEPPQSAWMQNEAVAELVRRGRQQLVKEKILHPNVLRKAIDSKPANVGTKNSWSQLMAACLISG